MTRLVAVLLSMLMLAPFGSALPLHVHGAAQNHEHVHGTGEHGPSTHGHATGPHRRAPLVHADAEAATHVDAGDATDEPVTVALMSVACSWGFDAPGLTRQPSCALAPIGVWQPFPSSDVRVHGPPGLSTSGLRAPPLVLSA